MLTRKTESVHVRRTAAFLLCLILTILPFLPRSARSQDQGKTVRVGWYESPWNQTDSFGRRSGYAYEYQCKIASYTGWNYEYVSGTWPDLMEMLIAGEIDLMSDVSYTKERTEFMLFPSYAMGTEEYYLFISAGNTEYTQGDYSYFNGKRIGVNKGSIQVSLFQNWAAKHGIQVELIQQTCPEYESIAMVARGELDGYVIIDDFGDVSSVVPVTKIGGSEYYFAVNKERPDLLADLETALGRIQDENRFYSQFLFEKYGRPSGANVFLNSDELDWLADHGTIRVAYQDNSLAYCARDPATGELTGALKDYLSLAADCMANAHLDFQPVSYSSSAAALKALQNGEVDCVFPCNLGNYEAEEFGIRITPSIMSSDLHTVVRTSDQKNFARKKEILVAAIADDPNYTTIILDHFPEWTIRYYTDIKSCLMAVSEGQADCFLISNYRYNSVIDLCETFRLTSITTGVNIDYSFAVGNQDVNLYSILARVSGMIPATTVSASLSRYFAEDARISVSDFIRRNPFFMIAMAAVLLALIVIIISQRRMILARKTVDEKEQEVEDLSQRIFIDALTSVRNKGAFDDAALELQNQLEKKEHTGFAVVMFDCDDLKKINDQYGHDKGDLYLKASCNLVCHVYKHSPVFRIGGDEFAAILQGEEYDKRDALLSLFETESEKTHTLPEAWNQVNLAAGMAVYDSWTDHTVSDVIRRADEAMYVNKRRRKLAPSSAR